MCGTEAVFEELILENFQKLKILSNRFIANFKAETMESGRQ